MTEVKLALISVSDKKGIVEFAKELAEMGIEILSTGGTASKLREAGIEVKDVSDYTGFPEMMETCANDGGCNSAGCIHHHGSECYIPELGDAICLEGDTLKCVCGCHSPGGP